MGKMEILYAVLGLIGGVGVFMVACSMMSKNLEALSSDKLKDLLSKISNNKLLGVVIGAIATALIQSSSATTVMAIGFVDAGIMSLNQAAHIIFGGEIGTTITGQIVALGMLSGEGISANAIFSALAGVGVFTEMFAKKDKTRTIARVITGFGMLFIGLSLMSDSMNTFAQLDELKTFLGSLNNNILLIIAGAILTAIIQSSSAMTSIAITMVTTGLINIDQGIYITLGANIGTCLTGALAGFSGGTNAKRTSLIQMIFNIGGVIIATIIDYIIIYSSNHTLSFGKMLATSFPGLPQTQLAMFHTIFNILSVVVVFPISNLLIGLAIKLVPEQQEVKQEATGLRFYYVNEYLFKTPAVAVQQTKNEIVNMADIALHNYHLALDTISTLDFSRLDEFKENEDELDFLNKGLAKYITKLQRLELNKKDHNFLSSCFHVIIDIERIGDYAENIVEYADALKENGDVFSKGAVNEIQALGKIIDKVFEHTMNAFKDEDLAQVPLAKDHENEVDDFTKQMSNNHLTRVDEGKCTPREGALFSSMASDSERVSDHLINIAETIYNYVKK